MPFARQTIGKILERLPKDVSQLSITHIIMAFDILVDDYADQRFSQKKHLAKLQQCQQNLRTSDLLNAITELEKLDKLLTAEKSSFAKAVLSPILIATQSHKAAQKNTIDEKKIPRETLTSKKPIATTAPENLPVSNKPSSEEVADFKNDTRIAEKTELDEIKARAATRIQREFRRFRYHLRHLEPEQQRDYQAFFSGNDFVIRNEDLKQYKQDKKDKNPYAFVGTSVLGSTHKALQLSNGIVPPKIIIIDNSRQVAFLWNHLREFAKDHLPKGEEVFFRELPIFLYKSGFFDLYRLDSSDADHEIPPQAISVYLKELCEEYGFEHVLKTISSTTVIKQSWQNKATFQKLKASLDHLGITKIFAYPSNIIEYTTCPQEREAIQKNIDLLKPTLAIFTSHSKKNIADPEETFLLDYTDFKKPRKKVLSPQKSSGKNSLEAILSLLKKNVASGHPHAQYELAMFYQRYFYDDDDTVDYKQQADWHRLAAKQGYPSSQFYLARHYEEGSGIDQDYKQAAYWYGEAAKQGHRTAQYDLGYFYEKGLGVDRDYKQALTLYFSSAKQGNREAQYGLGLCYQQGRVGLNRDHQEAARWFTLAARLGQRDAQYELAAYYHQGSGVEKNSQKAVYWCELAAQKGHEEAKKKLKRYKQAYKKQKKLSNKDSKTPSFWKATSSSSTQAASLTSPKPNPLTTVKYEPP